jgi:hypothetical protein
MTMRGTKSNALEGAFRSWLVRVLVDEALILREGPEHEQSTDLSGG